MASVVAFLIAQGWASGISTWGVLVATGVADRTGWIDAPGFLGSDLLLVVATVLLVIEVVADKVPYVDSASDTIQTLVRPVAGTAIAAEWGSADDQISTAFAAVLGGGSATASHFAKAGLRGVINMSPEPFSNVTISTAEDAAALTVTGLAFSYPWAAFIIAMSFLGLSILVLLGGVGLVRRRRRRRRDGGVGPP